MPGERADDGGPSGQRRKKARAADPSTSNTSGKASAEMLDHSAPKKRRTAEKLCEHQRRKSRCKDCGGSGLCEHQRQRSQCKDCRSARSKTHTHQRVASGGGVGVEGTLAPAVKSGRGRPGKKHLSSPDTRKSGSKQPHTESKEGEGGGNAETKKRKERTTQVCGRRTLPRRAAASQPKVYADDSDAIGEEEAFVGEEGEEAKEVKEMEGMGGEEDTETAQKNGEKERVHEAGSASSSVVAGSGVEGGVDGGLEDGAEEDTREVTGTEIDAIDKRPQDVLVDQAPQRRALRQPAVSTRVGGLLGKEEASGAGSASNDGGIERVRSVQFRVGEEVEAWHKVVYFLSPSLARVLSHERVSLAVSLWRFRSLARALSLSLSMYVSLSRLEVQAWHTVVYLFLYTRKRTHNMRPHEAPRT